MSLALDSSLPLSKLFSTEETLKERQENIDPNRILNSPSQVTNPQHLTTKSIQKGQKPLNSKGIEEALNCFKSHLPFKTFNSLDAFHEFVEGLSLENIEKQIFIVNCSPDDEQEHFTLFYIEKTASGLKVLHLDSTNEPASASALWSLDNILHPKKLYSLDQKGQIQSDSGHYCVELYLKIAKESKIFDSLEAKIVVTKEPYQVISSDEFPLAKKVDDKITAAVATVL